MAESSQIRVFASSHHQIAILGVKALIENTQRSIQWVGNEPPSYSILSTLERKKPNVLIADASLLQFNFNLPQKLQDMNIGLLIMIPYRDLIQQESLLKAGAKAVVTWNETPGTFMMALEQVAQLKIWFSPELGLKLIHRVINGETDTNSPAGKVHMSQLSTREKQVIAHVIRYPNATTHDLGRYLHLSPSTVRNYLSDIYKKLELKGKPALIAFSHEHQLFIPSHN
ncbi:oxygen regulatory protein NreC [Ferrovum sp. JA12]|uniref:response regulator transcription factor n=1 Tax=Ferrovum sp. JA12 TaxID=1356299 RepID=UPI000702BAE4|nr:LuxR C-terminal-related transcriptional regulator [Ferrovum sp. JA12]KRH78074.1 oxygen regulatory protein NreC [Ferrovum sp. JA12]